MVGAANIVFDEPTLPVSDSRRCEGEKGPSLDETSVPIVRDVVEEIVGEGALPNW